MSLNGLCLALTTIRPGKGAATETDVDSHKGHNVGQVLMRGAIPAGPLRSSVARVQLPLRTQWRLREVVRGGGKLAG